jgi:hypothetical protein
MNQINGNFVHISKGKSIKISPISLGFIRIALFNSLIFSIWTLRAKRGLSEQKSVKGYMFLKCGTGDG